MGVLGGVGAVARLCPEGPAEGEHRSFRFERRLGDLNRGEPLLNELKALREWLRQRPDDG